MTDDPRAALTAAKLRDLFASGPFTDETLAGLVPWYCDDVVFRDPIQTVRGRDAFVAMNQRLMSRARWLRFDVHQMADAGDQLFLTWTMEMQPKLPAPLLRVEGVTHCTLRDGRIAEHTDYWDLLGSVMGSVPVVGGVYRAAVRLIG